ncbi:MAG: hypothetical protein M3209_16045 [Acidobacteriota bacterium]|nr:hypothetical protein [Acidobacteriota bacterium]
MSNARRFIPRAVSFHIALAFTFVFFLVGVKGGSCPVAPPQPLRILYQQSEKIVVARLETIADDKILEENDERTEISVRNVFSVSSTLKGKAEPYVVIYETDYREKSSPEAEPETEEPAESTEESAESAESEETEVIEYEDANKFKIGKRLLLFLTKDEESDGYSLVDYRYGAKELSDADLRIYEKRIEEIGSILASPEKQAERTVEWLVRCAEEPATRWEGAYELNASFALLEWQVQHEAEEKAARERGEVKIVPTTDETRLLMRGVQRTLYGLDGDAEFAEILSNSQKGHLTDILLNALEMKPSKDKSEDEGLSMGDSALLELVGRWDDKRLVPFLLANLRNSHSAENYDTMRFMTLLAKLLKNEKLESLAESYGEIMYETDEEEETDAESESAENEEENDLEQESAEDKNESETTEESAEEKPEKTTYKQQREQILNEFIALCETNLAPIKSAQVRQKP